MNVIAPLISVVIPAYNYANTLERAVDSVMKQRGCDWELLVIDDGSTDDTVAIVEALHNKYGGAFSSIKKTNAGLANTRNKGIDETKGEYLLFLDADDELCADALSQFNKMVLNDSSLAFVMAGHVSVFPDGREVERFITHRPISRKSLLEGYLLSKSLKISNGACIMRRDIFVNYRYPEKFRSAEDISMFAYVLANFNLSVLDACVTRIHKHDDSLRHNVVAAVDVGMDLVEEVFCGDRIPEELQYMRPKFESNRSLSLFRTCYKAKHYQKALGYYKMAVKRDARVLLKPKLLIRFVKAFLKSLQQRKLRAQK